MASTVKLSEKLVNEAKQHANLYHRSIPKQIEYWSHIGKLAEENPDLNYDFIKDILLSLNEATAGKIEEYHFNKE